MGVFILPFFCGFDFGTSNTVVTLISSDDGNTEISNSHAEVPAKVFSDSSLLFLPDSRPYAQRRYVGQEAVDEYVRSNMNGRFIQSIKSILPDSDFLFTIIFEKRYTAPDLVAMIIRSFKNRIEDFLGREIDAAVFGRPVRFSNVDDEDSLAQERLCKAAEKCGFKDIALQYEPVAAASRYAMDMKVETTGIVCDFGGGTTDFSVIRLERDRSIKALASHGVRVGGDDFDGRIMWHRIVKYFGYGTVYESYGHMLPVPVHIFRTICRWERIAFLKTLQYRDDLKYIHNGAVDKLAIKRLMSLIDEDLGFSLFQAIRAAKHRLSDSDTAAVRFFERGIELKERISRADFGEFIAEELANVNRAMNETLRLAGVQKAEIHTAFLTGGSSLVQVLRDAITRDFRDAEMLYDTDRFNTVSLGLAIQARELQKAV